MSRPHPRQARTINLFREVYRHYWPTPHTPPIHLEYYPYASVTHTVRVRQGRVFIRLSDSFRAAPHRALRAVAHILFAKLAKVRIDPKCWMAYQRYVDRHRPRIQRHLRARSDSKDNPSGHRHNAALLQTIFTRLNRRHFHNLLPLPHLVWSARPNRGILGEYDALRHRMTINCAFQSSHAPRYVLSYLVFHEMLHMKFGVEIDPKGRRRVHTQAFREAERAFRQAALAKQWLQSWQKRFFRKDKEKPLLF